MRTIDVLCLNDISINLEEQLFKKFGIFRDRSISVTCAKIFGVTNFQTTVQISFGQIFVQKFATPNIFSLNVCKSVK